MTPINWFEVAGIFGGGVAALTYILYKRDQKIMQRSVDRETVTEPVSHHMNIYSSRERRIHAFVNSDTNITAEYPSEYDEGRRDMNIRLSSIEYLFINDRFSVFDARSFAFELVSAYYQLGSIARGETSDRRKAFCLGVLQEYLSRRGSLSNELLLEINRQIKNEVFRVFKTDGSLSISYLTS